MEDIDFHKLFLYEHRSGALHWKTSPSKAVKAGDTAGYIDKLGYVVVGIKGKIYKAHRIIFNMVYGRDPYYIDHKNGCRHDNRIENIRECDHQKNARNRRQSHGASEYKGVSYKSSGSRKKRWDARITVDRRTIHIGTFLTEKEAAKAYDEKAAELFGEFCCTNFGENS